MTFFATASRVLTLSVFSLGFMAFEARAMELDWHGQFRAESNTLFGYTNSSAVTTTGYMIQSNGETPATFQNLFLRLKPRALINDNVSLHSDLWLGTPGEGAFGADASTSPSSLGSSAPGKAAVTAYQLYGEVASDFGTIRVGRVPLNYGLGLVWNSDANSFDRYPSGGDAITLVTKLGAFKFMPYIVKYRNYNNAAGKAAFGNSSVNDYALQLAYGNDDEQLDASILFVRRLAGENSNVLDPFSVGTATSAGFAYNVWDFYVKKKAGPFNLRTEIPLASGLVSGRNYSSVAGVVDADVEMGDHWKVGASAGTASGQANGSGPATAASSFTAFSFHPDYRPGLLMFNYNYRNIAANSGSIYANPVTNARFLTLSADYVSGKFSHQLKGLYALSDTASDGVNAYFNTWTGHYETSAGGASQEKSLGLEFDYRLGYQWDESLRLGLDTGLFFPGKFYDYSATAIANASKTVFGTNLNLMVKF